MTTATETITNAADFTGIAPEHILHHLVCKAYTSAVERFAEGGSFTEEVLAAAEYFKQQIPPEEYTPTPQLDAMFGHFYMGFIQGFALGEHAAADKLPEARPIPQPDKGKQWQREMAAATRLAERTGDCGFIDCDCATIVYNANKETHQPCRLNFRLRLFGMPVWREAEREREAAQHKAQNRRSKVTLPEAVRITTNESPAERERRSAAAAKNATRTQYAPITDADSAAIVYNAMREAHPDFPFSFLLGQVYAAGKMEATQAERERRRKKTAG